jgi:hypothetical protein
VSRLNRSTKFPFLISRIGCIGCETQTRNPALMLKHNAIILQEFLLKKILPHKERWFYADRVAVDGCMSLEQKASSAVESQNQTMKWSASKRVTPSMSCCESIMTQDTQHKNRMDNRRIQVMSDLRSHPLWAKTHTATHVTKRAESVLQQRKSQVGNYAFRAVSEWEVQMVRCSKTHPYFCPNAITCRLAEAVPDRAPSRSSGVREQAQ